LSVQVLCGNDDPIATPGLAVLARKEKIHLEPRFSDHAPLLVDYDFSL
jgi:exodeoxyribonuclease-3